MPTAKRERKRQGQAARRAAVAAAQRRRTRQRQIIALVAAVALFALVVALISRGGGKKSPAASKNSTTSSANASTTIAAKAVSLKAVPPGATITGDTPCPNADGSSPRTTKFAKPPPTCINPVKTYTAEMVTSKGTITLALDAKSAPLTVNNFVVLARYHFYDGIAFHRIVPDFVDQVGDPQETGQGGPGYTFADELPKNGYKAGSVAMANSGPNMNGSQIFIVASDSGAKGLSNLYSLFGQVTAGLDVVQAINKAGLSSGQPSEVVTISSITIKES